MVGDAAVQIAAFVLLAARYGGDDELAIQIGDADPVTLDLSGVTTPRELAATLRSRITEATVISTPLLTLSLTESGYQITSSVDGAAGHYAGLLRAFRGDPDGRLRELPTLTPAESAERDRWNDTALDLGPDTRLEEPFLRQARARPDAPAVIFPGGTLKYGEVERRSRALATELERRGAGPGDLVAVPLPRGWQQVVAVLGILRAGAAYVPIEPDWPAARRRDLLTRCGCRLVIADDLRVDEVETPSTDRAGGEVAYVIFTSGSTGEPKGVVIDHRSAVNTILDINQRFGIGPSDRVLAISALSFDLSVYDIFGTLAAGGAVVMPEPTAGRDPARWAHWVDRAGVTVWNSVPALLDLLVGHAQRTASDLATLRLALLSGDWIPVSLPDRFWRLVPDARVISLGGATEGSIWSIAHPIDEVDPDWDAIPYGRPLANQRFHILDQHLQAVPVGVAGELYIGGAGVARRYWGDPVRTRAGFLVHPVTGERLYRTGDHGRYRPDGVIEFLGRRDQQVKVRGFRVELGEVEAVLRRHPGVRDAAVLASDGREARSLTAYVVPEAGADDELTSQRVTDWARVFDATYAGSDVDTAGWVSSETGAPFPPDEMREWADLSARRVLAQNPKRVLEIGCGTGLVLTRVAPHVEEYTGIDVSAGAIAWVRERLGPDLTERVRLAVAPALDLSLVDDSAVDTVVLNSVVQYFPSAGYLVEVLRESMRVLAPGGQIVVGDVRNLAFHGSERAELVLHPDFFGGLAAELPRLGRVEVQLKRAVHDNELSRSRYDVVLHFDTAAPAPPRTCGWTGRASLRALLASGLDELAVTGIPNGRLAAPGGLCPHELDALGTEFGYATQVTYSRAGWDAMDAVFRRPGAPAGCGVRRVADRSRLANRPAHRDVERAVIARCRRHLEERLPAYMVPSAFVVVDEIPLTANGKVDRAALPVPAGRQVSSPYVAPADENQRLLSRLWSEALGVSEIGIRDHFLELGGDSLRGLGVIAELTRHGRTLSVEQFFAAPTIAGQAELLGRVPVATGHDRGRGTVPLTPTQRAMVLHSVADPRIGCYLAQSRYRIEGPLERDRLERTWRELVARHNLLRSSLRWNDDGEPELAVTAECAAPISWVDLSGRAERIEDHVERDRRRGIDLGRAPLARLTVFVLDADRYEAVLTFHHVVLDGWSVAALENEAINSYRGRLSTVEDAFSFEEYVTWAAQADRGGPERFWRDALAGLEQPTLLAARSGQPARDVDEVEVPLSAKTVAALADVGRHRLTVGTVVHGAWAVLLSRYVGRDDVVFGVAVAGRPAGLPGVHTGLGSYVNTLPLRTRVPGDLPVADWLAEVRQDRFRAQRFEHVGLPEILGWSPLPPGEPLFDTVLISNGHPAANLGGSSTVSRLSLRGRTEWPVAIFVDTSTAQPGVSIQFDPGCLDRAAADHIASHLAALVAAIVDDPTRAVRELPMLGPGEASRVVGPRTPEPEATVDQLIAEQARRDPARVAVCAGGHALTYAELLYEAERLARRLRARGVGPGTLVGIKLDRSCELIVALLGVLRSGAGYVPLDPRYPQERLRHMIDHSGVRLVIGDRGVEDGVARRVNGFPRRSLDDTAYVIYTSGSTGVPKGVQVTHRALANLIASMAREPGISAGDRLLAVTTISFDIAALELLLPLTVGARVVIADAAQAADGFTLARLIDEHRITMMQATPTTWQALLTCGWSGASGLRCLSGGEALPPRLAAALLGRVESVWNLYGPTETTIWSTIWRVDGVRELVAIGGPIANTSLYVLDQRRRPAPRGTVGELCIGGMGLAAGYWRDLTLTSERFVRLPSGERVYRTGDLARVGSDGLLELIGRTDNQVKIRGFRVELGDIEAALLRHPAVRVAAVAVRGSVEPVLVGYVVPDGEAPAIGSIRRHLETVLPHHMIPGRFMVLDALPLTLNGKLDRAALPDPGPERPDLRSTYVPARDATERALAEVWAEALGLERVGTDDNYYELGGDSIGLLRVVVSARRHGFDISRRQLVDNPTIAMLAAVAKPADQESTLDHQPAVPRESRNGYTPADFPLAGLTQSDLDHVLAALGRSEEPHA